MGSKKNSVKIFFSRVRVLATGRVEWVDTNGNVELESMSWRDRWAVFGVHSYNWKWVRRLGRKDCGCTFNPVTRRKVLTRMDCSQHGKPYLLNEDWHGKAKHE